MPPKKKPTPDEATEADFVGGSPFASDLEDNQLHGRADVVLATVWPITHFRTGGHVVTATGTFLSAVEADQVRTAAARARVRLTEKEQ